MGCGRRVDWSALNREAVQRVNARLPPTSGENAIRPFVVGCRHWLFADTVAGANASVNLYSLLQTCLANGIDGYRCLTAPLVELSKARTVEAFEALLPSRLATAER